MSPADEISVRAHLERMIEELNRQMINEFVALRRELSLVNAYTKDANEKAERIDQQWRAQANEWRGTVESLITKYATQDSVRALEKSLLAVNEADRTRAETEHKGIHTSLAGLETWKSNMQGRLWGIPVLLSVVVFIVTQLMRVLFPTVK